MADPLKEALAEDGWRVARLFALWRAAAGMAYLVRRLLENTANESFLRQGFCRRRLRRQIARQASLVFAISAVRKRVCSFGTEKESLLTCFAITKDRDGSTMI